jgi:hypothetical protein
MESEPMRPDRHSRLDYHIVVGTLDGARARDFPAFLGYEECTSLPLFPFIQALTRWPRDGVGSARQQAPRLWPKLDRLLNARQSTGRSHGQADDEQLGLFAGVSVVIRELAVTAPAHCFWMT